MQISNNREEEMEIDLRDLFISVARQWRKAIIFGLVMMVLLGGFRFFKAYQSYQAQLLDEADKKESDFELWEYEQKKAKLEERISRIEEKLDQVMEYQDKSMLMSFDPYDYYWATCTYYVTTNYQIIPELGLQDVNYTDSVLAGYSRMVVDNDLYDQIRSALGMDSDDRYVSEMFRFSVDYSADMITVEAIGTTEAKAKELMNIICDKILDESPVISTQIHEHDIKSITIKTEHINYDDSTSSSAIKVKKAQDNNMDQYLELNSTIIDLREELDDLEKESPVVSLNVSGIVKYAVVGFVLGMCLMAFIYCVIYVLGDSIKTEEELRSGYGLPVVGRCTPVAAAKGFIDKRITRMQNGNLDNLSADQKVALMAAKISYLVKDKNETVVMTGTIDEAVSRKIFDQLKAKTDVKLEFAGNPLLNASAVEKITAADHVLVAERVHSSRRAEVQSQMEILSTLKKDVLGILLV